MPDIIPPAPELVIEKLEFEASKLRRTITKLNKLAERQTKSLSDAEWQLVLSREFGQLMFKAYGALLSYGIDYRKLRSFKNWEGIDYFTGSNTQKYREAITKLILETNHDIDAAIRRKRNVKEVDLTK